jgi:hypothetical protein
VDKAQVRHYEGNSSCDRAGGTVRITVSYFVAVNTTHGQAANSPQQNFHAAMGLQKAQTLSPMHEAETA